MIDDLTTAALEAIELAAGEAARAAFLASLEREAEALREIQRWKQEAEVLRAAGIRNNFIVGAICFIAGVTGTLIMRRR
ncbi:MAG: ABC transporter permease [Treponema sp.]|nr:ABC transporter permease [Treponema sp.]